MADDVTSEVPMDSDNKEDDARSKTLVRKRAGGNTDIRTEPSCAGPKQLATSNAYLNARGEIIGGWEFKPKQLPPSSTSKPPATTKPKTKSYKGDAKAATVMAKDLHRLPRRPVRDKLQEDGSDADKLKEFTGYKKIDKTIEETVVGLMKFHSPRIPREICYAVGSMLTVSLEQGISQHSLEGLSSYAKKSSTTQRGFHLDPESKTVHSRELLRICEEHYSSSQSSVDTAYYKSSLMSGAQQTLEYISYHNQHNDDIVAVPDFLCNWVKETETNGFVTTADLHRALLTHKSIVIEQVGYTMFTWTENPGEKPLIHEKKIDDVELRAICNTCFQTITDYYRNTIGGPMRHLKRTIINLDVERMTNKAGLKGKANPFGNISKLLLGLTYQSTIVISFPCERVEKGPFKGMALQTAYLKPECGLALGFYDWAGRLLPCGVNCEKDTDDLATMMDVPASEKEDWLEKMDLMSFDVQHANELLLANCSRMMGLASSTLAAIDRLQLKGALSCNLQMSTSLHPEHCPDIPTFGHLEIPPKMLKFTWTYVFNDILTGSTKLVGMMMAAIYAALGANPTDTQCQLFMEAIVGMYRGLAVTGSRANKFRGSTQRDDDSWFDQFDRSLETLNTTSDCSNLDNPAIQWRINNLGAPTKSFATMTIPAILQEMANNREYLEDTDIFPVQRDRFLAPLSKQAIAPEGCLEAALSVDISKTATDRVSAPLSKQAIAPEGCLETVHSADISKTASDRVSTPLSKQAIAPEGCLEPVLSEDTSKSASMVSPLRLKLKRPDFTAHLNEEVIVDTDQVDKDISFIRAKFPSMNVTEMIEQNRRRVEKLRLTLVQHLEDLRLFAVTHGCPKLVKGLDDHEGCLRSLNICHRRPTRVEGAKVATFGSDYILKWASNSSELTSEESRNVKDCFDDESVNRVADFLINGNYDIFMRLGLVQVPRGVIKMPDSRHQKKYTLYGAERVLYYIRRGAALLCLKHPDSFSSNQETYFNKRADAVISQSQPDFLLGGPSPVWPDLELLWEKFEKHLKKQGWKDSSVSYDPRFPGLNPGLIYDPRFPGLYYDPRFPGLNNSQFQMIRHGFRSYHEITDETSINEVHWSQWYAGYRLDSFDPRQAYSTELQDAQSRQTVTPYKRVRAGGILRDRDLGEDFSKKYKH